MLEHITLSFEIIKMALQGFAGRHPSGGDGEPSGRGEATGAELR